MTALRIVMMACSALVLGACKVQDPATQAPVTMKPGAYETSLSGPIAGLQGPGANPTHKICIQTASETTPKLLITDLMVLGEYCNMPSFTRQGNALTGKSVCPMDPSRATGTASTEFTGTVAEDAIDGTIAYKLDAHPIDAAQDKDLQNAALLMQSVKITFKARRLGECDGSEASRNAAQKARATFSDDNAPEGGGEE
jgi:hypothetical protein